MSSLGRQNSRTGRHGRVMQYISEPGACAKWRRIEGDGNMFSHKTATNSVYFHTANSLTSTACTQYLLDLDITDLQLNNDRSHSTFVSTLGW